MSSFLWQTLEDAFSRTAKLERPRPQTSRGYDEDLQEHQKQIQFKETQDTEAAFHKIDAKSSTVSMTRSYSSTIDDFSRLIQDTADSFCGLHLSFPSNLSTVSQGYFETNFSPDIFVTFGLRKFS